MSHRNTTVLFKNLLVSLRDDNHSQFLADADSGFRSAITAEIFGRVSADLQPRLASGCDEIFLGELQDRGAQVFIWKLSFSDGGDDLLARMGVRESKVSGFKITSAFA
ncbi:MAG: hypothetical protein ABIT76_13290 [Chthoniobacterales bacterium]